MISFDNIDKYSPRYDFYMNFIQFAHNKIYYRKFYILNKENIPPKGTPTFVIANHQNGFMDAMAILHTMFLDRRQPVFLARGDIFKKDGVARILRFLKIMPTFRTRDGGVTDVKRNLAIFNRAAKVLKKGGTIVIFPEAAHQHGHYMSTFKKGFSRIAFAAEEMNDFKLGVQILPLNIHYSNYFNFQSDLSVTVGKPFTYEEFFDLYKQNPNEAYLALNEKARARVKELTPDIDIPEYYNEIELLTQMMSEPYLKHKGFRANYLPNQKDAAMTIIANLKLYKEQNPDGFVNLMLMMRKYMSLLRSLSLHNWVINRKLSVFRMALRILLAVITLPVYLFGQIVNLIPGAITRHFTKKVKDPMLHSSFQFVIGSIICFPVYYILLFALIWIFSKKFLLALAVIVLAVVCVIFDHYYTEGLKKLYTYFRGLSLRKHPAYQETCKLNTEITDIMEGLLF